VTDAAQSNPAEQPEKSAAQEVVEIVKTVVYALLIALVLRILLFQPFTIPSASMEPTLLEGDYIIVSKYSYGYSRHSIPFSPPIFHGRIFERTPKRGDIIVFKLPRDGHTDYIKRLIGLPGDRIQVKGGVLFINGKQLPRRPLGPVAIDAGYGFIRQAMQFEETMPNGRHYTTFDFGPDGDLDNTGVFIVPQDHYFFMGDNRDNSTDYIKRLIGLPGDEITVRQGVLFINGKEIPRKRIGDFVTQEDAGPPRPIPAYQETLPNGVKYTVLDSEENGPFDNVGPYKVPEGKYFMMGDNRDNSTDSRASWGVGYVPFDNLIGRAEIIFFSAAVDEPGAFRWWSPWTWPFDIRWNRFFKLVR
jgi:signal peptidase I